MGDMSRVFSIGKLPEKAYVAHQVCLDIQEAVVEKAKPGAVCEDLYNLAIDIVTKAGFADNFMGATQKPSLSVMASVWKSMKCRYWLRV